MRRQFVLTLFAELDKTAVRKALFNYNPKEEISLL